MEHGWREPSEWWDFAIEKNGEQYITAMLLDRSGERSTWRIAYLFKPITAHSKKRLCKLICSFCGI